MRFQTANNFARKNTPLSTPLLSSSRFSVTPQAVTASCEPFVGEFVAGNQGRPAESLFANLERRNV